MNFKLLVISDQGVYWSTQYFNAIFSIQLLSFKRKLLMLAEVGQNFSSLIPGQLEARQCSGMVVVWWEPPSQESMYEHKVILYKSWVGLSRELDYVALIHWTLQKEIPQQSYLCKKIIYFRKNIFFKYFFFLQMSSDCVMKCEGIVKKCLAVFWVFSKMITSLMLE